jgi:hypothetical protein
MRLYAELSPYFEARKSFKGKATVEVTPDTITLFSYDTKVATYSFITGEYQETEYATYSQTTRRHVREFKKQLGLL